MIRLDRNTLIQPDPDPQHWHSLTTPGVGKLPLEEDLVKVIVENLFNSLKIRARIQIHTTSNLQVS